MESPSFDDILKHLYELEGLVMVARRDDTDHELLMQQIHDKFATINQLFISMDTASTVLADTVEDAEPAPMGIIDLPIDDTGSIVEEEEEENCDNTEQLPCEEELPAEDTHDEAYALNEQSVSGLHITDDEDLLVYVEKTETEVEIETDEVIAEEDTECEAAISDPTEEEIPQETSDVTQDPEPETEHGSEPEPEPEMHDDDEEEGLTVDTLLQRNISRDLKKAFTINDRFRFLRELFGNNNMEMTDALNMVEAMHSYAEAEEYFYDMLNWDKESPEVADFMTIIRNHFYAK